MSDKDLHSALQKSFTSLTEDYRNRSTRIDARIMLRMDISDLQEHCSEEVLAELIQRRDQFINDYTHWKNFLKKPNIRHAHIQDFSNYLAQMTREKKLVKKKERTPNAPEAQMITPIRLIEKGSTQDMTMTK